MLEFIIRKNWLMWNEWITLTALTVNIWILGMENEWITRNWKLIIHLTDFTVINLSWEIVEWYVIFNSYKWFIFANLIDI